MLHTAPLISCHHFVFIILDDGSLNVCEVRATARTCDLKITIPVEPSIKWLLDTVDCLLMMESLMEDPLMEEEEKHSFRAVGDKNHRQANFSTSVILTRQNEDAEASSQKQENITTFVMVVFKPTCISCVWWRRWKDCRWWRPLLWLPGQSWSMVSGCWHD